MSSRGKDMSVLLYLPPEEWVLNILPNLCPSDLSRLALVSRYMYLLATDNYLWRRLYQAEWGLASFEYENSALSWLPSKANNHIHFTTEDEERHHRKRTTPLDSRQNQHLRNEETEERRLESKANDLCSLGGGIFWKDRFGTRARWGTEAVLIRVQYDDGRCCKTIKCAKSDLVGELCLRIAHNSNSYRRDGKYYKDMLDSGAICYTEELDYLVCNHSSFQLFKPANKKYLSSTDTVGTYFSNTAETYKKLKVLELEFKPRIQFVRYATKINDVVLTRTILTDAEWPVRQIIHAILKQMQPQIPSAQLLRAEDYVLLPASASAFPTQSFFPRIHVPALSFLDSANAEPLRMDLTLLAQDIDPATLELHEQVLWLLPGRAWDLMATSFVPNPFLW